jgi:hypothetical protein
LAPQPISLIRRHQLNRDGRRVTVTFQPSLLAVVFRILRPIVLINPFADNNGLPVPFLTGSGGFALSWASINPRVSPPIAQFPPDAQPLAYIPHEI